MKIISELDRLQVNTERRMKDNSERNISLWLDSYDDIFSDFDPRPFSGRNISDDFLYEVKKVVLESEFNIGEIKLQIPEKIRNSETENTIIQRLYSFFEKNKQNVVNKKQTEMKKGFLFIIPGVILMTGSGLVSSLNSENIFMYTLLMIIEPAGWFFVWSGMEILINTSRKEKPELDFYNKISKSKIVFLNIQPVNNQVK